MMRPVFLFIYKVGMKLLGGRGLYKIYLMGLIYDFLSNHLRTKNRPEFVNIKGSIIYLDPLDNLELSIHGENYEKETRVLFEKILKPGDVMVDVGAHIGYYSLLASTLVGPTGKIFSFEPSPDNFFLLQKNVQVNNYKNLVLINKAVGDKERNLKLFLSNFNSGDNRIYDSSKAIKAMQNTLAIYDQHKSGVRERVVDVPVIALDNFFKDYPSPICLIKIDTQGAEGKVIFGASSLLKKNKNISLIIEFWPAGLKMCGTEPKDFLNLLADLDFRAEMNLPDLLKKYTVENNLSTNLLFTK